MASSDDRHPHQEGLGNYWGYNTIAFFATERAISVMADPSRAAKRDQTLHEAGIEVILDGRLQPHGRPQPYARTTLDFRGIAHDAVYAWCLKVPRNYYDERSRVRDSLNLSHPPRAPARHVTDLS